MSATFRPTPGVHLLDEVTRSRKDDLAAAWRQAGWRVVTVSGGATLPQTLRLLGDALDLPDHYGVNLDALWDCLSEREGPTAVLWTGWQGFHEHHRDDWNRLIEVLIDASREDPGLAVLLG